MCLTLYVFTPFICCEFAGCALIAFLFSRLVVFILTELLFSERLFLYFINLGMEIDNIRAKTAILIIIINNLAKLKPSLR